MKLTKADRTYLWCLQKGTEGAVLLLFVVTLLAPGRNGLSVEDDHVEEGIQQQNRIRTDALCIQQCGLWRPVERVGKQGRLDHHQRVHGTLPRQDVAIVRRLIRTRVEQLQELRSTQMEHVLRIHTEFR